MAVPGKRLVGALLFLGLLFSEALHMQAQRPVTDQNDPVVKPDLNLLRERVTEFWSLLHRGRRLEAMEYVDPAMRNNFMRQQEPPFISFVLRGFSFSQDPARVRVSVNVLMKQPMSLDWPVEQTWTFQSGSWFVLIPKSDPKHFFGGRSPDRDTQDPAVLEAESRRIEAELNRFTLSDSHLDLGEVKEGEIIRREIRYHNQGKEPIMVRLVGGTPWIGLDRARFYVVPGEEGTIQIMVVTGQLDGKISASLSFLLQRAPVEVERQVTLEGYVRAPVSLQPKKLILQGRSAGEILIHNNLQKEIRIRGVVASHEFFQLVDGPLKELRTIGPGEGMLLKVKWDLQAAPKDWQSGWIQLRLAEPVEDRTVIFVPVLLANPDSNPTPNPKP